MTPHLESQMKEAMGKMLEEIKVPLTPSTRALLEYAFTQGAVFLGAYYSKEYERVLKQIQDVTYYQTQERG